MSKKTVFVMNAEDCMLDEKLNARFELIDDWFYSPKTLINGRAYCNDKKQQEISVYVNRKLLEEKLDPYIVHRPYNVEKAEEIYDYMLNELMKAITHEIEHVELYRALLSICTHEESEIGSYFVSGMSIGDMVSVSERLGAIYFFKKHFCSDISLKAWVEIKEFVQ
jgi:hypothetical protein